MCDFRNYKNVNKNIKDTYKGEIQKAHMLVFAETKRMLEQAAKVKAAQDKLFAIAERADDAK